MNLTTPSAIFIGLLQRAFLIVPSGESLVDIPGGNVLYASVGWSLWEPDSPPGMVARVGEDYPQAWLEMFQQKGLDIQGVTILPEAMDVRHFCAFTSRTTRVNDDPVSHYARLGLPFPKALLGYHPPAQIDSRTRLTTTSLRQGDIPELYLDVSAAHLCPVDYLTHSLLPALLRQSQVNTITLDPAAGYMNPSFFNLAPTLVTGLSAFLPSEEELRFLFQGRSTDLWEMMEALAAYGCDLIVVKRGEGGQALLDAAAHKKWEIPAYPARLVDPGGAGDAFCGGFLAGYRRTYDPLEAVLTGNIAASMVVEGSGPFYALDALPGLAQARLEAVRQGVRRV
jgi:sugar/nucleoside kinase (ribokinase family)